MTNLFHLVLDIHPTDFDETKFISGRAYFSNFMNSFMLWCFNHQISSKFIQNMQFEAFGHVTHHLMVLDKFKKIIGLGASRFCINFEFSPNVWPVMKQPEADRSPSKCSKEHSTTITSDRWEMQKEPQNTNHSDRNRTKNWICNISSNMKKIREIIKNTGHTQH